MNDVLEISENQFGVGILQEQHSDYQQTDRGNACFFPAIFRLFPKPNCLLAAFAYAAQEHQKARRTGIADGQSCRVPHRDNQDLGVLQALAVGGGVNQKLDAPMVIVRLKLRFSYKIKRSLAALEYAAKGPVLCMTPFRKN